MTQKRDEKVRFSFQEKEKMNENQLLINYHLALITTIVYYSNMFFYGLYFLFHIKLQSFVDPL